MENSRSAKRIKEAIGMPIAPLKQPPQGEETGGENTNYIRC